MDEPRTDAVPLRHNGDGPAHRPGASFPVRDTESANLRADAADRRAAAADNRADAADHRADLADLRSAESHQRLVGALTFFAEAEHRIKTGLTVVRGWAQMLDEGWDNIPDDRRRQGIAVMHARSVAMSVDADKLLDGVRAEAVMKVDDKELVRIGPVLRSIASAFVGLPIGTAVIAAIDDDPVAFLDSEAFEEVLLHLVENAIKYSPEGGEIVLRARSSEAEVLIDVIDAGVGLPEDVDIFAPFSRGETAAQSADGSGLGLYVVARLVRAMGGTIDARRNDDGGSTFSLALPGLTVMSAEPSGQIAEPTGP